MVRNNRKRVKDQLQCVFCSLRPPVGMSVEPQRNSSCTGPKEQALARAPLRQAGMLSRLWPNSVWRRSTLPASYRCMFIEIIQMRLRFYTCFDVWWYILCLCQVLASYINPSGCVGSGDTLSGEVRGHSSALLPSVLQELLSQSCLIPAMSSYLRNDSGRTHAAHGLCWNEN